MYTVQWQGLSTEWTDYSNHLFLFLARRKACQKLSGRYTVQKWRVVDKEHQDIYYEYSKNR